MRMFENFESEVRGYVRSFPAVFASARGAELHDESGNRYIDFFAGAGALNYGHNHPAITRAMIEYLRHDGVVLGLDMATVAKRGFIARFVDTILAPRNLDYRIQFTGPTGTNAVEAALKLARMVKGRSGVVAFTNGYHGLTMGSLAVTGNAFYREEAFPAGNATTFMPFDGYLGPDVDTLAYFRRFLEDKSSGVDVPAAVIVETVQGEGGLNVASVRWLKELERLCREFDMLLLVDDIQMGNGRTGTFFSFERAGITPDMVTLSKSLGGGLPMSILLIRRELDRWKPGQHTGTFRGNNLAFVAATEALGLWDTPGLMLGVAAKGAILSQELVRLSAKFDDLGIAVRGLGMAWGMDFGAGDMASRVSRACFERGLVIETAGANVLKVLPPLVIEDALLREGLEILDRAVEDVWRKNRKRRGAA